MQPAPYPSLADFAATLSSRESGEAADFAVSDSLLPPLPEPVRDRLEEVLDTVVALQRAEWLEDGVYVGPRAMPEVYRAVLDASRRLEVALPPAIVARVAMPAMGTYGTDSRAFLLLSSFFVRPASPDDHHHEHVHHITDDLTDFLGSIETKRAVTGAQGDA